MNRTESLEQLPASARKIISGWIDFLEAIEHPELLKSALEVEPTDDGTIYPIATPDGLIGDFAVVDMGNVRVDTPHFHTGDETEVHIPLIGKASMSIGRGVLGLAKGDVIAIEPEVPHFIVPDGSYSVGVLSLPNYNPDNQISVDLANPGSDFNTGFYAQVTAL